METTIQNKNVFQRLVKHPITIIIMSTLLILIATVIVKELITKPLLGVITTSEVLIKTCTALIGGAVMIGAYKILVTYYEKNRFTEFSLQFGLKESVLGLLIGLGSMSAVVLLLYFLGYYELVAFKSVLEFLPTIAFILGAAILEEIIFRGLVFRIMEQWKGPIVALIVSSLIFQLPHFMNSHTGFLPGLLGVLYGLVVALMYADTRRLWLPIAFHFGWNIAQPVLGTTLSGVSEFTTLTETRLEGPELIVGSGFGVEVSIFSFMVLVILGVYYVKRLNGKNYFGS